MLNKHICIEKEPAYKLIQRDIKDRINSGALAAGVKLLPENELIKIYNTNLYHIRNAIRALKREKLLTSEPKVGVFVSGSARKTQPASDNPLVPEDNFRQYQHVLSFMPAPSCPEYTEAWQKITESFMGNYPFYHIEINANYCQDTGKNPDIKEYGNLLRHKYDMSLLNLRPFIQHDVQMSSHLLDDFALPLYYSTEILIFNKTKMAELKLPQPTYATYKEQVKYLEEAVICSQRNNYAIPGTRHIPVLRMGRKLRLLAEAIMHDGHAAAENIIDEFTPVFEEITAFWRKYRISPPKKSATLFDEFATERSLLFMGFSDDIVKLKQRDVEFEWGTYPFLNLDGHFLKIPLIAALSKATCHQVECIRFLSHVQNLDSQKLFAKLGCIPTREKALEFSPYFSGSKFRDSIANGEVIFFNNTREQYLCMNIIDIELWNCILHDKPCAEAINDSIILGRAYLSSALDAKIIDQLDNKASLYT